MRSIRPLGYHATHPSLISVPKASAEWSPVYAMPAGEDQLPWPILDEVWGAVRASLDPVLADAASGTWLP